MARRTKSTKFTKKTVERKNPSRKPQSSKSRTTDDRDENFDAYSKANDAAWYAQNAQLMSDVASFSYNYPVGSQMPADPNQSDFIVNGSVPGIMTLHVTPRFGVVTHANDPINIAMRNINSFVRHANSGHVNYEGPDLMLYLMAMDSCFSFIEMLKRVYGTILTYSFTNRYFPLAAVRAQGFDFVDLQANLSDFRAYINTLAVKVGSMCIPASMSYMARHMWMYSGMYYDTPSDQKAQVYMYVPEAFYAFNHDADGAGCVTLVDFDRTKYKSDFVYPTTSRLSKGWNFRDIQTFGNNLIDPIIADEDMNIMSGDILKAFGPGNVYMVQTIPENYTVLPVYNQEVLTQFHNATMYGRGIDPYEASDNFLETGDPATATVRNSIIQSPDKTYLTSSPRCFYIPNWNDGSWSDDSFGDNASVRAWFNEMAVSKKLLDFETGPVSPADAMVASRCVNFASYNSKEDAILSESSFGVKHHQWDPTVSLFGLRSQYDTCGSETVGFAKIWYWANVGYNSDNQWSLICSEDIYSSIWNVILTHSIPDLDVLQNEELKWVQETVFAGQRKGLLSSFNMHPAVSDRYLIECTDTENDEVTFWTRGDSWPQFDINYYTVLDQADVDQMHATALLSQFNVTQYGRKA